MEYVGFVYKWTNRENNMFYIGSHKGFTDDGYVSSGNNFLNEYKKNKKVFDREILEFIYDINIILEREQYYFDLYDLKNNTQTYNVNIKAAGGWAYCYSSGTIIDKRNKSIRNGFLEGRIIHNKGKRNVDIYTTEVVNKLSLIAKDTIGKTYNRNKGDSGKGLKNTNSKIVTIQYLHGDLRLICEGSYYKWFSSGTYKKTNPKIWKITFIDRELYNPDEYNNHIRYDGEKYDKLFLSKITNDKNILGVHNKFYYLCEHLKSGMKIISDLPKNKLKKCLKGGTGKTIWKFEIINFEEYINYKNKYKYYDGRNKLCSRTIEEYCSYM